MSKATKLRTQAQNRLLNQDLLNLVTDKLTKKPQKVKSVTDITLSNGEKGQRITFDQFA